MKNYRKANALHKEDENRLMEVVNDTLRKSKFYQNFYDKVNFNSFSEIPFISKQQLIQDQIENPPFGTNTCVNQDGIVRVHRTSGTSSKPLLLVLTKKDVENVSLAGKRAFLTTGMNTNDVIFNCMNYCMWMGGFMDHQSIELTGAVTVPYGVGHTENLVKMLLDIENPSIHATPSYLNVIKKVLFDKFNKKPRDLGLRKGFFGGEPGIEDKKFRDKIEEEWGMEVINANYGMSEAISIMGAECSYRQGLHFTGEDFLFVELISLTSEGNTLIPIKKGAVGELVVTTLAKEAQPLIRYRTGDVIQIISVDPCPCGEKSFRFKVIGRKDDMVVVKGINFYPELIRPIISSYQECTGNYIIKIPNTNPIDKIKIIIEATNENNHHLAEKIRKDIRNQLFITPLVELVEEINNSSNKLKIIQRVEDITQ